MSARALTMEEMENVNGGLVLEDHGVGSTDHLSMTQERGQIICDCHKIFCPCFDMAIILRTSAK